MKNKVICILFVLMFCIGAIAQSPAITMTTGKSIGSTFTFTLAAEANNTPIKVDFGDGTQLSFTIESSETTISGTLKSTRTIKIYGTGIIAVDCSLSQLTALDVSNNNALKELDCHGNRLTSLNLTTNAALESLSCQDNQIAELDLANKTELYSLICNTNKITELKVTNNTKLIELTCNDNQISSLDITNNTKLEFLFCQNNLLSTLDVSKNTALWTFWCQNNQFTFATLPLPLSADWVYLYKPQRAIAIAKDYRTGNTVDLSNQLTIDGKSTVYTWKTKEGTTLAVGTDYNIENGKSTFLQTQTDSIYCEMTNPSFNNFKLKTTCTKVLASNKQDQTITFAPLPNKKTSDTPFELIATASSALPLTYTSSDPSVASITGNTVTILKAGTITITATQDGNDSWNSAIAEQTLTITSVTGIGEDKETLFSVYPNPTADMLYFKGEGSENISVSIFNLTGAKVWSGMAKGQNINVSQLPAGVYILKTNNNKEIKTIRFVKHK